MPDTKLQYTRAWTNVEDFPHLGFTRNWENPADFPTYEPDEMVVRRDMQSLHDEVRDYINGELIPAVVTSAATEADRAAAEEQRAVSEQQRQSQERNRQAAEERRVSETEGIVARAATEANRAQAEADRATVPAVEGVYNMILTDRVTGERYALIVENGRLALLGVAETLEATDMNLIDTATGTAYELTVESGRLTLKEV